LDADFNPNSRLRLRTFLARSDDTAAGSGRTGGVGAVYRGPIWRWSLDALEIGERFDPQAGFLQRQGVRRYAGSLTFVPRPELPHIRNLFFEQRAEVYTTLDGRLDSLWNGADLFSFRTKSNEVFSLYSDLRYERLTEPFEIPFTKTIGAVVCSEGGLVIAGNPTRGLGRGRRRRRPAGGPTEGRRPSPAPGGGRPARPGPPGGPRRRAGGTSPPRRRR